MTGHDNRRNGRCKCATVTSPDVQQSRQKADPAQGWRDRPDTFKAPFANAHVNGITTQKEQPRKNFPPWWFFHILSAQGTAAMSSAGSTQRGTKAEGWDGLNSSNEISRRGSHPCPLWWHRVWGCTEGLLHLSSLQCHTATPRLYLSPQEVRDICKNGNQTARMDVAVLGARLQEKALVKKGQTWL